MILKTKLHWRAMKDFEQTCTLRYNVRPDTVDAYKRPWFATFSKEHSMWTAQGDYNTVRWPQDWVQFDRIALGQSQDYWQTRCWHHIWATIQQSYSGRHGISSSTVAGSYNARPFGNVSNFRPNRPLQNMGSHILKCMHFWHLLDISYVSCSSTHRSADIAKWQTVEKNKMQRS